MAWSTEGPYIELEPLLESRDRRRALQEELLTQYGRPLVSFMVNMPGPVKDNPLARRLHQAGWELLAERFRPHSLYSLVRPLATGWEGYLVVNLQPLELKRQTAHLEDTHPLGRLFDFDVHAPQGQISRSQLDLPPRLCLICSRPAPYCARSRTHSVDQLLEAVGQLAQSYFGALPCAK